MSRMKSPSKKRSWIEIVLERGFLRGITLLMAVLSGLVFTAGEGRAEAFGDHIHEARDYRLVSVNGQAPSREMNFRFHQNPTYTPYPAIMICGRCLCVTGVLTGRYPEPGMRTTSGSPTLQCPWGSEEFEEDAKIANAFFQLTGMEADDAVLTFTGGSGQEMQFRLRTDMESCLNWHTADGKLAVKNICDDSVRVQIHAPLVGETRAGTVTPGGVWSSGLSREETRGYVYAACPVGTAPTVPFDESGFAKIRASDYECR